MAATSVVINCPGAERSKYSFVFTLYTLLPLHVLHGYQKCLQGIYYTLLWHKSANSCYDKTK